MKNKKNKYMIIDLFFYALFFKMLFLIQNLIFLKDNLISCYFLFYNITFILHASEIGQLGAKDEKSNLTLFCFRINFCYFQCLHLKPCSLNSVLTKILSEKIPKSEDQYMTASLNRIKKPC